jgi:transcriptional regulator with XRE-family HTH domain
MLSPRQIRAGRALLGWEAKALAERTNLSRETICNIETGKTQPHAESLDHIAKALIAGGVEFTASQGVRLRTTGVEIYQGADRFEDFCDFTYEQVKANGGDVCLSVTDERLFSKYRRDTPAHYRRMQDLYDRGIMKSFRILANQSNFGTIYTYTTYRWQPEAALTPTAFYVFAQCLALLSFAEDNPPFVVVIQSPALASAYRLAFDAAWNVAKPPPKKPKAGKP